MATYNTSSTSKSITVTVTPDAGYNYVRIFCRLSSDSSSSIYDNWGSNASVTISGLIPGTSYTVNVQQSQANGSLVGDKAGWIGAQTVITNSGVYQGSFSINSYDSSSVTFSITPDNGYNWFRISYRFNSSSSVIDQYWTQNRNIAITGLSPNTQYAINVYQALAEGDTSSGSYRGYMGAQTFTTTALSAFEWQTDFNAGVQVVNGQIPLMAASDWNRFCDFCENAIAGVSLTQQRVISGEPMLASTINQTITALSAAGVSGLPNAVTRGERITRRVFVLLAEAVNNTL